MESKPRILLIDDDRTILAVLSRVLERAGYEVDSTTSPVEGLVYVEHSDYAVAIVDYLMPQMNGLDALERIGTLAPDTVRIMLTGQKDMQLVLKAVNEAGVFRYLVKPWKEAELLPAVEEAVQIYSEQVASSQRLEKLQEQNRSLRKKVMERTRQVMEMKASEQNSADQGFSAALKAMAQLSDVATHSRRVAQISKDIARQHGLKDQELIHIELAASLHDIGKIKLPEKLLKKPKDKLTITETEMLQRHTVYGESILHMAPNMDEAALLVRHHHECFDGSGYPNGLAGEQIPLGARIIGLASAFDHARYDKTYPISPHEAFAILQERVLKEFDPELYETLGKLLPSRTQRKNSLKEIPIPIIDLRTSMILTRDLLTPDGAVLIPKDRPIARHKIDQLVRFHESKPLETKAYVLKTSIPPDYEY